MSGTQFEAETGLQPIYSAQEMKNITRAVSGPPASQPRCEEEEDGDRCLLAMWTSVEELVQDRKMSLAWQRSGAMGLAALHV
mmetsp:Transcript_54778/g.139130  ORF Transcript_54778/g.139130 Transcript_54778/m.139130 type:complete len:82 (-) Transcript_54778:21-266(-)